MIAHGKEIKVFTGNSNPSLAQSICQELYMGLGNAAVSQFAVGGCSI
jgi:ribose-phosphate pyrophosphokinase